MRKTFYKYKNIDNFKFLMDSIINNRLFAGKYKSMNDPMEGVYLYSEGQLNKSIKETLFNEKNSQTFCCLSKQKNNYLMWSHYANGHRGIVFGVEIDNFNYFIKDIEYFSGITHIDNYNAETSREILSRKLNFWEYEDEVRVFTKNNENYINVTIKEIILGAKMELEDETLIRKLVKKINPDIHITKNYII